MGCKGCGDKDVKEIAEAGAKMARKLTDRLSGRGAEKAPQSPQEGQEPPEAPQTRVTPLKKLSEKQSGLIRAKLEAAREARAAAEELISMAMPNVPDGIRVVFDVATMTFYKQEIDQ